MTDTETQTETPAPAIETSADLSDHRAVAKSLDQGLSIIAESDEPIAHDAYRAEREARRAFDKTGKLTPEQAEGVKERWTEIERVAAAKAATEAALAPQDHQQAEQAPQQESPGEEWQRLQQEADRRDMDYDAQNPGYFEKTARAREVAGEGFTPLVARILTFSEHSAPMIDYIADNPQLILDLNRADSWTVHNFVQRFEGAYANQIANQKIRERKVSKAPPPPSTVKGRAHSASKTLDDMSYDEYKAARMKGKR